MKKINEKTLILFFLISGSIFSFIDAVLYYFSIVIMVFFIGEAVSFIGFSVIHSKKTLGLKNTLVFFITAFCISLVFEYSGTIGLIPGCQWEYTEFLGPMFLGKVPYFVLITWFLFLYYAFTMTNIIFGKIKTTKLSEERFSIQWLLKLIGMSIVAGLIMTSWDLINDPVMVAMGAWKWPSGGAYYGIPLSNFMGWIIVSFLIYFIFSLYLYKIRRNQVYFDGDNRSIYTPLVVVSYLLFLIFYAPYAVYDGIGDVIPWATITMGSAAAVTIFRFHRSCK